MLANFMRYELYENSILLPGSGFSVATDDIPSPILDHIWNKRACTMNHLINLLTDFYNDILPGSDDASSTPKHPLCNAPECVEIAIGSLVRSLRAAKLPLEPLFNSYDWRDLLIWILLNRLRKLTCVTIAPWSLRTRVSEQAKSVSIPSDDKENIRKIWKDSCPGSFGHSTAWGRVSSHLDYLRIPVPQQLTLLFVGSYSAYNMMCLRLHCPTLDDPHPPPNLGLTGPGRCGIANRMQKFNTDITAISQKLLGFKHKVGSADFGEG